MSLQRYLASGGMDGEVRVWSLSPAPDSGTGQHHGLLLPTLSTHYTFDLHDGDVFALAWSPNGEYVASGGRDKTVQVWNVQTGEMTTYYQGHSEAVYALAWSPESDMIASGGRDKTVQVWDAKTEKEYFTYYGHDGSIYTLAWSPDGRLLASGGDDKEVQVWGAASGELLFKQAHQSDGPLYALAWSHDGQHLVAAGGEVSVYQWKTREEQDKEWGLILTQYEGHAGMVYAAAFSPVSSVIATSGFDRTVQVWDSQNGRTLLTYADHSAYVRSVAFSPDGALLASASRDGTVQVWDAHSGKTLATYWEHQKPVYAVTWAPSPASADSEAEVEQEEYEPKRALSDERELDQEEGTGRSEREESGPLQVQAPSTFPYSPPLYSRPAATDREEIELTGPFTSSADEHWLVNGGERSSSVFEWEPPTSPFTLRLTHSARHLTYFPRVNSAGASPSMGCKMKTLLLLLFCVLGVIFALLCVLLFISLMFTAAR
jgi:WD40 repeat protein